MAPSLPGSSGRRGGARNSLRASSLTIERQDSESEDFGGRNSPSRSKRPARQAAVISRPRGRPPKAQQQQQQEDEDEDEEVEEAEDEEMEVDDKESSQGPIGDEEEIEGEIDEVGETKITKDGELLGGRQYKCRSFKLPERGDRIYMLSMDPARVLGFRDSYLFFLKNPQLVRVNTTVEERQWMIEHGMLMANFKSKLIAVVTARSIFKSFGAKIIKGGKSRVDDYFESNASEDAIDDSEGDATSRTGDDTVASGSTGYNNHMEDHSSPAPSKRKYTLMHEDSARQITDLNWQYESAMAVRALNSRLKELRKGNPKFLDPHTNIEQIPTILQPTRCDVHVVPDKGSSPSPQGAETEKEESAILSVPRSIGPQVDANVKVEIKPGAPLPPLIHDASVWAVIPEDIRRVLEEAEITQNQDNAENDGMTRFPISLLSGQYQAAYPLHQTRFQRPYNIVLPQGMTPHAHYIRHLWSTQPHPEPILMEQETRPGDRHPSKKKSTDQQPQQQYQQQPPQMPPHPQHPQHPQHLQQHPQQQQQGVPYQMQPYQQHSQQYQQPQQQQHLGASMPIQASTSRRR
ncbi:hypothetical protein EC991_006899 [Linnemannia zychae]|nr:hypothetical protein EC991_006899 [Linnemannia zychae]